MSTITVRDLDEDVKQRLQRRAAANGRSMEAEVRQILSDAVVERDFAAAWLDAVEGLSGEAIPVPPRSLPREVHIE